MPAKDEIIFSNEDKFKIVSEILAKNGIYDSLEAAVDAEDNKPTPLTIVLNLSKDFAKKTLSEKEFTDEIEKRIKVSRQAAANIAAEIKIKLLPYAERIAITGSTPESLRNSAPAPAPIRSKAIPASKKNFESSTQNISPSGPNKSSSGSDRYREPIA